MRLPPALIARSAAERYVADLVVDCQGVAALFDANTNKKPDTPFVAKEAETSYHRAAFTDGPILGVGLPSPLTARSAAERYVADLVVDCQGVIDHKIYTITSKSRCDRGTFLKQRDDEGTRLKRKGPVPKKHPKNVARALFGDVAFPPLSSDSLKEKENLSNQTLKSTHSYSSAISYTTSATMDIGETCEEIDKPSLRSSGEICEHREAATLRLQHLLDPRQRQFHLTPEDGEKEHARPTPPCSAKEASSGLVETLPKNTWRHSRLAGLVRERSSTGDTNASALTDAKEAQRRDSMGLSNIRNVVLNEPLMTVDVKVPKAKPHPYIPTENVEQAAPKAPAPRKTLRKSMVTRKSLAVKALEERLEEAGVTHDGSSTRTSELCNKLSQVYHSGRVDASTKNKRAVMNAMQADALIGYNLLQLSVQLQMSFDDISLLKSVFDKFDVDEGGTLDTAEFEQAVVEILRLQLHDETVSVDRVRSMSEWYWWEGDTRADGRRTSDGIDFKEFAQWFASNGFSEEILLSEDERKLRQMAKRYDVPPDYVESVKRNFDYSDKDLSGEVNPVEFREIVYKCLKVPPALQKELPWSRVQSFWAEIDTDGSGSITFSEFFAWWIRYYEKSGASANDMPFDSFYKRVRRVGANYLDPPAYPPNDDDVVEPDEFACLYRDPGVSFSVRPVVPSRKSLTSRRGDSDSDTACSEE